MWVDEDGNMLSQSIAILNALARHHGYAPKGLLGDWANAWVSDTITDFMAKGHHWNVTRKSECTDDALKQWVTDSIAFNETIEKHLAKWNTKFLAGDNPTACDFHLFGYLNSVHLNPTKKYDHVSDALAATLYTSATPKLNAWIDVMKFELKDHMSDPNRPARVS